MHRVCVQPVTQVHPPVWHALAGNSKLQWVPQRALAAQPTCKQYWLRPLQVQIVFATRAGMGTGQMEPILLQVHAGDAILASTKILLETIWMVASLLVRTARPIHIRDMKVMH